MATVSIVILKHQIKKDKTYNVKIRISHNRTDAYIETQHFVNAKQLDKTFKIKDKFILDLVYPKEKEYRDRISTMGDIDDLNAKDIRDRLTKSTVSNKQIDFLAFSLDLIKQKVRDGKEGSSKTLKTVVNSLSDYFGTPTISISEINYSFLVQYEAYLRRPRKYIRKSQVDSEREYIQKGIGNAGLHNHMRDLRLLFNAARDHFNDEDQGIIRIPHYPFKKYKVGTAPLTKHRNRTIIELKAIRDVQLPEGTRAELARDLFMLSFYMLGMNAADLYELNPDLGDRIDYNRSKTRGKRKDDAFISVKVIELAKPLLEKYAGKLQVRYSNRESLNKAIDIGLKVVSDITGIPEIDFYDARHSVGTLGRNVCGFSTEEIAIALNQKERTVTDIYIAPDWSTVDKVQEAVTSLLMKVPG